MARAGKSLDPQDLKDLLPMSWCQIPQGTFRGPLELFWDKSPAATWTEVAEYFLLLIVREQHISLLWNARKGLKVIDNDLLPSFPRSCNLLHLLWFILGSSYEHVKIHILYFIFLFF